MIGGALRIFLKVVLSRAELRKNYGANCLSKNDYQIFGLLLFWFKHAGLKWAKY